MKDETFYKRCPVCKFATGFCLKSDVCLKDHKYVCTYCGKESKLSSFRECKEHEYNEEVKAVSILKKNRVKLKFLLE